MNILENIEKEQIEKLMEGKNMPTFKPGDTLRVHTKVKEATVNVSKFMKVFALLVKTTV